MLIKDWCYYESRILGAHHGLISTYALETLILYIFHIFDKSLDGPLAVSYVLDITIAFISFNVILSCSSRYMPFLGGEMLSGLLQVLYRFLDYYSKFDWDNKGISLFGPVSLSSLPKLVSKSTHS
jgi:hypothetical protein